MESMQLKPNEISNILIEQSVSLKYSNMQYILHRLTWKPLLDMYAPGLIAFRMEKSIKAKGVNLVASTSH